MTRATTHQTLRALTALAAVLAGSACGGDRSPTASTAVPAPVLGVGPAAVPTYALSGIVVERVGDGLVPVEGAYVEACGFDAALSGADGRFQLTQMPPDTPSVFVQKAGYLAQSYPLTGRGNSGVEIVLVREPPAR